jgi:outer membrane murein-binding lipoprotein Lpp
MSNIQIESDLKDILSRIDTKLDKLSEDVTDIKVSLAEVKGDIKATDEKLSGQIKALDTKVDQLDKRVGNQEFTNRGVFVGLLLTILGGVATYFGWIDKP